MRHRRVKGVARPDVRVREVPLAVMMVALTTLTLWSLGQAIVVAPPENASVALLLPSVIDSAFEPTRAVGATDDACRHGGQAVATNLG